MISVADRELCEKLHRLSGWSDTAFCWNGSLVPTWWPAEMRRHDIGSYPAYDLGYLLRQLPLRLDRINARERDGIFNLFVSRGKSVWVAGYTDDDSTIIRRKKIDAASNNNRYFWWVQASADTPENAVAKLAIELFKGKLIEKEDAA